MTIIWIWLALNVGFALGAWWASRPVVRGGANPESPHSDIPPSRTNLRRIK